MQKAKMDSRFRGNDGRWNYVKNIITQETHDKA